MTYPAGPGPEMPQPNPNWSGTPQPGPSMPYNPMSGSPMPGSQLPYPPMPSMAPPPPKPLNPRTQRNLRLVGLVGAALAVLLIAFNTLPSALAGGVRAAYPNVKAVITGATDQQTIQPGQSLQFSATNSIGNNLTYSWDFGDNATSTQATITHTFSTGGQFTVTLEVKDPLAGSARGHDDTTSIIIIAQYPAPVAYFTYTNLGSDGYGYTMFTFDASGSTGNTIQTYYWTYGDGYTGYGPTVQHSFYSGQSYTVTLTVTDASNQSGQISHTISA